MNGITEISYLNRSKIAEYFGVSLTAIDGWTRKGCPFERKGKNLQFDPQALSKWLAGYRQEAAQDETPDSATERYRLAKAIRAETENKILEGQYILRSTVADELVKRVYAIKRDQMALERRLTKWPEVKEIVKKAHRAMWKAYSRKTGPFRPDEQKSER